ncbi:MAG TPA: SDR family oxidoreductase [Thermoleophilaceae bacterium]|nr:SDR family oxidoreductase [Thermoleophilaceae bacterium]
MTGELFSVKGKTAVVTGGSRGIGLMIARGLLEAGAEVVISSRKADQLDAAAAELSEIGKCIAVPADLSSQEGAIALADAVRERFDRLDILVNNAGASWGEPIDTYPDKAWDRVLDTNVRGVFQLTVASLDLLRESASADDPARVINIGSVDGLRPPMMESYAYSASKAAVHQLTRHLAKRLAAEQITVNAIAPGPFPSKMMAFVLDDPDARAVVEQTIPLGRIGEPDDVAGLTIFLASRAGAYLTGTVIPLDGGYSGAS